MDEAQAKKLKTEFIGTLSMHEYKIPAEKLEQFKTIQEKTPANGKKTDFPLSGIRKTKD